MRKFREYLSLKQYRDSRQKLSIDIFRDEKIAEEIVTKTINTTNNQVIKLERVIKIFKL